MVKEKYTAISVIRTPENLIMCSSGVEKVHILIARLFTGADANTYEISNLDGSQGYPDC